MAEGLFFKDSYEFTKGHAINGIQTYMVSLECEGHYGHNILITAMVKADGSLNFKQAIETNNKTNFSYVSLDKFETMHPGLFADINKKFKEQVR